MRIAIISHGYPSQYDQQWGCFERDQAQALQRLGHRITILYIDGRFRKYWRRIGINHQEEDNIQIYGIYLFPLAFLCFLPIKFQFWVTQKMMSMIFNKMIKMHGKPDIIYAHYLFNIARAVHIKEKYNIPLIGMEHWSVLTLERIPNYVKYIGQIAYNSADRVFAVSKSLSSHIYRHFHYKADVIYDMLGQEFLNPYFLLDKKNHSFSFIGIGSLIKWKRFDLMIKAFISSGLSSHNCSLIIIGDGNEYKHLNNIIKDEGEDQSIRLLGRRSKKDILQYLQQSDCFVLASKAETFGVACIDALSQGLPVISTKCGGPEEFVDIDNGVLIEVDNVGAMKDAMIDMYNNYKRYNRQQISENCLKRFSPNIISQQLNAIFLEIFKK